MDNSKSEHLSPPHSGISFSYKCGNYNLFWNKFDNKKIDVPVITTIPGNFSLTDCKTPVSSYDIDTTAIPSEYKISKCPGMDTVDMKMAHPELEALRVNKNAGVSNNCIVEVCGMSIRKPRLFNQILTSVSIALVSMVTGFVSAYTSPATESLKDELKIADEEISWIGGLVPLGALIGGLVGGQLIDLIGRKTTILITNILFLLCWTCISVAPSVEYLFIARCIMGFSVGTASLAMPVYLGETLEPEVRGTLGLLPTAFGNIGILICFVAGTYLSWRNLSWLGAAISLPFLLLTFVIPETPRWYMTKRKEKQAYNALQWLWSKEMNAEEVLGTQTDSQNKVSKNPLLNVLELLRTPNNKPLLIALGLMFFQQLSGITAVIYYTTDIFKMSGSTIDKNLCTIIVGIVNFSSTFIATVLIDRLGRKILLYTSSISMAVTLTILGAYFYLLKLKIEVSAYGWIPLASFVVYVLGFSLGFGPVPWLMLGEIFPAKIRGTAASVTTAFHWTCSFIVTKTFADIIQFIGPHSTFWLFGLMCGISFVFVIVWVPETRGQSLQDIERQMVGSSSSNTSS